MSIVKEDVNMTEVTVAKIRELPERGEIKW